jgi:hypothetical protein
LRGRGAEAKPARRASALRRPRSWQRRHVIATAPLRNKSTHGNTAFHNFRQAPGRVAWPYDRSGSLGPVAGAGGNARFRRTRVCHGCRRGVRSDHFAGAFRRSVPIVLPRYSSRPAERVVGASTEWQREVRNLLLLNDLRSLRNHAGWRQGGDGRSLQLRRRPWSRGAPRVARVRGVRLAEIGGHLVQTGELL